MLKFPISLGYIEVNFVSAFQEYEFEYVVDDGNIELIHSRARHVKQCQYKHDSGEEEDSRSK